MINKDTFSIENLKQQRFFIATLILFIVTIVFFVFPKVSEFTKIKLMEHNINTIIKEHISVTQSYQKEVFTKKQEEEVQAIVKKYAEKEHKMAEVYKEIEKNFIEKLVAKKKEAIILGKEEAEITLLEETNIKKAIIQELLSRTEDDLTKEILNTKLEDIQVTLNEKDKVSMETPSSDSGENTKSPTWNNKISRIAANGAVSTTYSYKKLWPNESKHYETKPHNLDLSIIKEDGDILFYDRTKIWFPIDLGITFPTLFSYSNAGINPGKTYYDLHQGIDFRTLPYGAIPIKFPENKTGVVVYAKSDTYGLHLIIDNKELQERYEYAHLSSFNVKEWDVVKWGQVVAVTGNTGPYSVWDHLHYAVYKNWFLTTHDWGIDVKKTTILKSILSDQEIEFVKPHIGKRPAGIFEAVAIFIQLPQDKKTAESFSKIIQAINNAESNGKYAYIDIVTDPFIKENIKLTPREIVINIVRTVDNLDKKRKFTMIDYFKKDVNNMAILFHEDKLMATLWRNISSAKVDGPLVFGIKIEKVELINEKVDKAINESLQKSAIEEVLDGKTQTTSSSIEEALSLKTDNKETKEIKKNEEKNNEVKKEDIKKEENKVAIAPKSEEKKEENKVVENKPVDISKQRDDLFNDKYMTIPIVAERRKTIDIKECKDQKSNIFSLYTPLQSKSDGDIIDATKIANFNHLFPLVLSAAKEIDIANRINSSMGLTGDQEITNCEIALIEMGKVYQEHNMGLDNPDRAGLFQVLTNNYYKEFPEDKGKKVLSDAQYKKQAKDSMEHSFGKLSYFSTNKETKAKYFRGFLATKDFVMKYWTWSYHGLVWDNPDTNYYTSNNLMYKSLLIRDISAAPWARGYRDGAFTTAVKYYKLTH